MSRHLTYRSGNPVLNKSTFLSSDVQSEKMTINGTVNKTLISLILLITSGYYCFTSISPIIITGGAIGGLIVAIITIFKKEWAPITVPIYALLEGCFLGGISYMYNTMYEGIVSNAIFLTIGILLSLLFAYKSGWIKPTENFKLGLVAATGGIFIVYLVNMVMSFFGSQMGIMDINNSSMFSKNWNFNLPTIDKINEY